MKDEEIQEMGGMQQPQPTQQPIISVGQPQRQQQMMMPMPTICVLPINGGPDSEPADVSEWLPDAGGDGAWSARTGSGPMLMRGNVL